MSAEDQYYENRKLAVRYGNYVSENRAQRKSAQSDLSEYKSNKKNLEKRLEDVKNLISKLDGTVSENIVKSNSSGKKAEEVYVKCIKCSQISSGSLVSTFGLKGVLEDSNSEGTYTAFVNEKKRLEQAIAELERLIRQAEALIASLGQSIRNNMGMQSYYENEARKYYWQMKAGN